MHITVKAKDKRQKKKIIIRKMKQSMFQNHVHKIETNNHVCNICNGYVIYEWSTQILS